MFRRILPRASARLCVAHPFADLLAHNTALVVIDLQNPFLIDATGYALCPAGRDIAMEVNQLSERLREAGGGVFWVMETLDTGAAEAWYSLHAMLAPKARAGARRR